MNLKHALLFAAAIPAAIPLVAHAWWDDTWTERRVVVLDTSATGVETAAAVSGAVLPVRLHSGNFDFAAAKPDGSDIRFVAADDKTPLKYHVERFDGANELAVVWVQVPQIAPKTAGQKVYVYFGNAEAPPENVPAAASFDASTSAVLHFREGEARPLDASANANNSTTDVAVENAGLLGASARFSQAPLVLAASPSLNLAAGGAFTFSGWIRFVDAATKAALYAQGPVVIRLDGGKLSLEGVSAQPLTGGALAPNAWHHVAVKVGAGKTAIYVNGAEVVAGEGALPAVQGEVRIGEGLAGMMDEVQIANTERSADWIKLAASAQGAESKLLTVTADEEAASGGEPSYMGILLANLTFDAWVVIAILMVMLVIAIIVMYTKARLISVTDKGNRDFLSSFRHATTDFLELDKGATHKNSSLFRLYQAGIREVKKRTDAQGQVSLGDASINAIKASVDAEQVRESHKLGANMVLLTIAISGGPFLGLLGTVVGVMIVFAAIAAAGDVNVNAIAPGVAAALLATVAGLAVAIPALFGYNYLASRIKNISADMQIFVDEFITRIAESYGR
ncbi:MAG: DUF2341 domain-containing protein [Rugosibacter sp.]|nr:DUF2341 domain-containing protein [Rugosibacter sp.]